MKWKKCFAAIAFLLPMLSLASDTLLITEIMFDPDGSDSGREWVEWHNNGGNPTSIEGYKFREGGVNHTLKIPEGASFDWIIQTNSRVVIVDNPEKFILDNPNYTGQYYDSSFSLKNDTEEVTIVNTNNDVVFTITYSNEWGGVSGASVSLFESIWKNSTPTPGLSNQEQSVDNVEEDDETEADTDSQEPEDQQETYIAIKNNEYKEKVIKADAGGTRTVLAGAPFWFYGQAYGLVGEHLENAKYSWNFGDGERGSGNPEQHTYYNTGTYTASLTAISGNYSGRDLFSVQVVPNQLHITGSNIKENTITITNDSKYLLNISSFIIKGNGDTFTFPEDSFISANNSIVLNKKITSLEPENGENFIFMYPNRNKFQEYIVGKQESPAAATFTEAAVKETPSQSVVSIFSAPIVHAQENTSAPVVPPKTNLQITASEPLSKSATTALVNLESALTNLSISNLENQEGSTQSATNSWPGFEYYILAFIVFVTGSYVLYTRRKEPEQKEETKNEVDSYYLE